MTLIEEVYDGELNFEIVNDSIETDHISMDLVSEYNGQTVGLHVDVPIKSKRVMFKNLVFLDAAGTIEFSKIDEKSDRLIKALDELWTPDFEVEGGFSEAPVEIEFSVLNKEMFDCTTEKTYIRIYNDVEMETGDSFDDIHVELGFNFNLGRKRASFIEKKKAFRNDFLAMIMA